MYSWTQASRGSAQICWPLLVRKLWREQRYYIGHAWSATAPQFHPCGRLRASPPYRGFILQTSDTIGPLRVTYGHKLRVPPFCCLFLSSFPSPSGHIFPGSLWVLFHARNEPQWPFSVSRMSKKSPIWLGLSTRGYTCEQLLSAQTPTNTPLSPCPCLPKGEQEDWHLHNTMFGALVTGPKVVNYMTAGDPAGYVGEAAGRCCVHPLCGGIRTTGVSQEHRQAQEGQREVDRDDIAQPWGLREKESGNNTTFLFVFHYFP